MCGPEIQFFESNCAPSMDIWHLEVFLWRFWKIEFLTIWPPQKWYLAAVQESFRRNLSSDWVKKFEIFKNNTPYLKCFSVEVCKHIILNSHENIEHLFALEETPRIRWKYGIFVEFPWKYVEMGNTAFWCFQGRNLLNIILWNMTFKVSKFSKTMF